MLGPAGPSSAGVLRIQGSIERDPVAIARCGAAADLDDDLALVFYNTATWELFHLSYLVVTAPLMLLSEGAGRAGRAATRVVARLRARCGLMSPLRGSARAVGGPAAVSTASPASRRLSCRA
jgi:hypothetical protein